MRGWRVTAAPARPTDDTQRPRVGVSACLLGEEVRFDGGHKRNRFLVRELAAHVDFVLVCPEAELGLGTPRESLRLVGSVEAPRMVGNTSGTDHTDAMNDWSRKRAAGLASERLDGYVLKKDSPSCGLLRVRVHPEKGGASERTGRGLFAAALAERHPLLAIEEEGRLSDARLRENFIERLFVSVRWRRFVDADPRPGDLVAFHARQKYALLAHSPSLTKQMGQLVGSIGQVDWPELVTRYAALLHECLGQLASAGRHANVLQHLAGTVKEELDAADKAELNEVIDGHREGRLPLIVPLTLLRHHLRKHDAPAWAREQTYLNPYPEELMPRNHV